MVNKKGKRWERSVHRNESSFYVKMCKVLLRSYLCSACHFTQVHQIPSSAFFQPSNKIRFFAVYDPQRGALKQSMPPKNDRDFPNFLKSNSDAPSKCEVIGKNKSRNVSIESIDIQCCLIASKAYDVWRWLKSPLFFFQLENRNVTPYIERF